MPGMLTQVPGWQPGREFWKKEKKGFVPTYQTLRYLEDHLYVLMLSPAQKNAGVSGDLWTFRKCNSEISSIDQQKDVRVAVLNIGRWCGFAFCNRKLWRAGKNAQHVHANTWMAVKRKALKGRKEKFHLHISDFVLFRGSPMWLISTFLQKDVDVLDNSWTLRKRKSENPRMDCQRVICVMILGLNSSKTLFHNTELRKVRKRHATCSHRCLDNS